MHGGGEQAGIELAHPRPCAGIDEQVGQGVQIAHRADVAYFGPFDTQRFGLRVNALGTGALGIEGVVEWPVAMCADVLIVPLLG